MKEFKCTSFGLTDGWKHRARTDDLLLDTVAVHLHEIHGMKALSQEMLAKIRNAFTVVEAREAARDEDLILREYTCDRDPACTWRYIAQTEDLIVDGVALHDREKHGVREFTPEMAARVKKAIHPYESKKHAA